MERQLSSSLNYASTNIRQVRVAILLTQPIAGAGCGERAVTMVTLSWSSDPRVTRGADDFVRMGRLPNSMGRPDPTRATIRN